MANWRNAALRSYIEKLPRAADVSAARIARFLAEETSRQIERVGAVDTGELLRSPAVTRAPDGAYRVTVRAEHGIYVNYGTYKMAARPFWEPALAAASQEFAPIAIQEFRP